MRRSRPDLRSRARSLLGVGLVTGAYMLAAVWGALRTGNAEFVFYIGVMVVLIATVAVIHARVGLSPGLLWGLCAWGALHMAGGLVAVPDSWPTDGGFQVLYSWWIIPRAGAAAGEAGGWLKYDQLTHAYGFGIATWLCWQGLRAAVEGDGDEATTRPRLRPTAGLMLLVAFAGMGLGATNEIIEFTATRFTETNVGGYENTGWDLVFNALGAAIAAGWILVAGRRGD